MKKILSLLLIFGALVVSGCSCAQRGEYEFHSIRVKVGEEEKVYACSDADKLNPLVAQTCLAYDDTEIKLAKDDKILTLVEDVKVSEAWYKIEDGKLYVSQADSKKEDSYEKVGTYKKGVITLEIGEMKVIFKKD